MPLRAPKNSLIQTGSASQERVEIEALLRKLDQTEDRLTRSERNYAEIWRKYEKSLETNQSLSAEL